MGGAYAGLAALILGQASSSFWLLADGGADEHAAGGRVLCQVRYYQECIQPRLPLVSLLLVGVMAAYGIAVTYNMFSIDRARAARASELRANAVSDTSVDNGWECNFDGARITAEGQVLCCAEKRGD